MDAELFALAESGNCEFYTKIEEIKGCETASPAVPYPLSYGFRYCFTFKAFEMILDSEVHTVFSIV
jgi:hypothetical protein